MCIEKNVRLPDIGETVEDECETECIVKNVKVQAIGEPIEDECETECIVKNDSVNNDKERKSVTILSLNVCGLVSKLKYDVFVEKLLEYDIVCLSETKTDQVDEITVIEFAKLHGYHCFCKSRKKMKRKSGGLCVLISNDIVSKCKEIKTNSDTVQWLVLNKDIFEADRNVLLGNVYIPPITSDYSNEDIYDELKLDLIDKNCQDYYTLLMGDFNAHTSTARDFTTLDQELSSELEAENTVDLIRQFNCNIARCNMDLSKIDTYGRNLLELCKETGLCIYNGRVNGDLKDAFTTAMSKCIDYVIGSPKLLRYVIKLDVEDYDGVFSDVHSKLILSLVRHSEKSKTSVHIDEVKCSKLNKWQENRKNEFIENLNEIHVDDVHAMLDDPDCDINKVTGAITKMLTASAKITFGVKSRSKQNANNYNKECYVKKKKYNQTVNKVKYVKNEFTLSDKKEACREYKAAVKRFYRQKDCTFHHKLRRVRTTNSRVYWSMLNRKSPQKAVPDIENLKEHFVLLSECNNNDNDEVNDALLHHDSNYDCDVLNRAIESGEILKSAAKLKCNKSAGDDELYNEYLKASVVPCIDIYVKLFNCILDTGKFPEKWSVGLVVPLYKNKGDKNDCNNYRGITLLSCLGKLFTSIINERLRIFCENNKVVHENQAGFRSNYSTIDHVFSLKSLIDLFFVKRQKLYCAFIDYKKAFDTVWRKGLWYKLDKEGISKSTKVYQIITSMYKNIKSCVLSNGKKSDFFASNLGVRQGENLSPLLFTLYINDLEEYLLSQGNNHLDFNDDVINGYLKLYTLLYADDTIILANTAQGLQNAMHDLDVYCTNWKLEVNVEKTKVMIFRKRITSCNSVFTLNGQSVDVVNEFKYLGVLFSYNGLFKLCKQRVKDQATRGVFALLSRGRQLKLPVDVMVEMFQKTIVPILLYGSEVWGCENSKMLEAVQLKFCKYLLGLKKCTSSNMLYYELGLFPMEVHVKIRVLGYWLKLLVASNTKISKLLYNVQYHLFVVNGIKSKWLVYIYDILHRNGLGYVWLLKGDLNVNHFKNIIKKRLQDQFLQDLRANIEESSKCMLYREIKADFQLERYLIDIPWKYSRYILKLRLCNHKLSIETGRYSRIVRNQRICELCSMDLIGDEYHLFFECNNPTIVKLRHRFIPNLYTQNPSMYKFISLMKSIHKVSLGVRVGKFLMNCNMI